MWNADGDHAETLWLRTYVANLPPGDECMFLAERTSLKEHLVDADDHPYALHKAKRNEYTLEDPGILTNTKSSSKKQKKNK